MRGRVALPAGIRSWPRRLVYHPEDLENGQIAHAVCGSAGRGRARLHGGLCLCPALFHDLGISRMSVSVTTGTAFPVPPTPSCAHLVKEASHESARICRRISNRVWIIVRRMDGTDAPRRPRRRDGRPGHRIRWPSHFQNSPVAGRPRTMSWRRSIGRVWMVPPPRLERGTPRSTI
jgi:hypothetical protein